MARYWWRSRCEHGHMWEGLAEEGLEPDEARTCPFDGSSAVTVSRRAAADRVGIRLIPAARVDPASGKVDAERKYYFEIDSTSTGATLRSGKLYAWAEGMEIARHFDNLTWERALRVWEAKVRGSG